MKASPPPNPSPEPAAVPAPAAETTADPAPGEPAPVAVPEPPAAAEWPAWHAGADWAAALLVLVGGFLAGSFVARNSDIWLHLAGGRAVASGAYLFGADPFGSTTAGVPWVNTSWLFDLGAFATFSLDPSGAALVVAKAAAFAAAFGLPLLIRRPGGALWPWVAFAAAGVLAAAPFATLRPPVASMLFLSATLVLLFARPWDRGSRGKWRHPLILGGLFALWANVDAWFILGPLTVGLTLVGELLHRKITGGAAESAGEDAVFPVPAVPDLARAFAVGVAGCLLNPSLLAGLASAPGSAVAQVLPPELGLTLPAAHADDRQLYALTLSPLNETYMSTPEYGYNRNGIAALVVLVGGALSLGAGFARLRASHVVLWAGFVVLAALQFRLIAFLAVVAVPLAAAHLNGVSAGVRLRTLADPRTRILVTASGILRIVSVTAALGMVAAAYPGWLHTQAVSDPALVNRVEWAVEPDPGLVRAAGVLEAWRADGDLPADVRGLNLNPDFGNVCAWFAPREKVAFDSRYGLHANTLDDILTVRRGVYGTGHGKSGKPPSADDSGAVPGAVKKLGAGYVTVTAAGRLLDPEVWLRVPDPTLWHLDGRTAVVGLDAGPLTDKLAFNPVRLAFGAADSSLPEGPAVHPPAEKLELFDEYVQRPKPNAPFADDALALWQYAMIEQQRAGFARTLARAAAAGPAVVLMGAPPGREPPAISDDGVALAVLIARAGRRAVAANPDRPEGYYALAAAYQLPALPVTDAIERDRQIVAASARFLARLQPADVNALSRRLAVEQGLRLTAVYVRTNQSDLALATARRVGEFARQMPYPDLRASLPRDSTLELFAQNLGLDKELTAIFRPKPDAKPEQAVTDLLGFFDKLVKNLERVTAQQNDIYEQFARNPQATATRKFLFALQRGLTVKGCELYLTIPEKERDGNREILAAIDEYVTALLVSGRVEDAADFADGLVRELGEKANPELRVLVRRMQYQIARIRGNFRQAAELLTELGGDRFPKIPDAAKGVATRVAERSLAHAAAGGFPGIVAFGNVAGPAQQVLLSESNAQYTFGVFALSDGNIPEAKRRFEFAARPQGVPLADLGDPARAAEIERYLRLIAAANPAK